MKSSPTDLVAALDWLLDQWDATPDEALTIMIDHFKDQRYVQFCGSWCDLASLRSQTAVCNHLDQIEVSFCGGPPGDGDLGGVGRKFYIGSLRALVRDAALWQLFHHHRLDRFKEFIIRMQDTILDKVERAEAWAV